MQILAEDELIADPEEIDKLNENNDIMKELLAEKDEEIKLLKGQIESAQTSSHNDLNDNGTGLGKHGDTQEEEKEENEVVQLGN
mgnify:CR=1 FL=1